MKKVILLFVVIVSGLNALSQTQGKMNSDAGDSLHAADKELNEVYRKILTGYSNDTLFIKNLKISQKLWIQFRDAEMNMKYPERKVGYYGSVLPMCWAIYKEQLTRDRTKTLKQWLDGIEEGDVCAGSVKKKVAAQ